MENKIHEIQNLEQTLQNLMFQKQAFQMELLETQSALKGIEESGDEIFKIIGQLMVKTEKEKIKKEMDDREKILDLRINSIEKQENSLMEKLENFREEIIKSEKK